MKFLRRLRKTGYLLGAVWAATAVLEAPAEARAELLRQGQSKIVSQDNLPATAPQSSFKRVQRAKSIQKHPSLVKASLVLEEAANQIQRIEKGETLVSDKNGGDEFPGQRRGGGTHAVNETLISENGGDEFPGQRRGGGTHAIDENNESA